MTEKEIDKYLAPQAFHEHTEEYDSWFEDSLVYEIEVTALRSLHVEHAGFAVIVVRKNHAIELSP